MSRSVGFVVLAGLLATGSARRCDRQPERIIVNGPFDAPIEMVWTGDAFVVACNDSNQRPVIFSIAANGAILDQPRPVHGATSVPKLVASDHGQIAMLERLDGKSALQILSSRGQPVGAPTPLGDERDGSHWRVRTRRLVIDLRDNDDDEDFRELDSLAVAWRPTDRSFALLLGWVDYPQHGHDRDFHYYWT